jgi:hypothetical protein
MDRSLHLAQFVSAGIVSSIDQLNAMPQPEFDGLLIAFEDRDSLAPLSNEADKDLLDLNALPNLSIEERIRALKVPKNPINIGDRLERGRAIARNLLGNHNTTAKPRILSSPLTVVRLGP